MLVVELAVRGLESAAELRSPADTRHPAARADAVAELAPIAAPVADHAAFVAQAVLIDAVHIPTVLPLADLDCQRENFRHSSGKSTPADSAVLPSRRLLSVDVSSPAYSKYTANGTVSPSKNRDVKEAT